MVDNSLGFVAVATADAIAGGDVDDPDDLLFGVVWYPHNMWVYSRYLENQKSIFLKLVNKYIWFVPELQE